MCVIDVFKIRCKDTQKFANMQIILQKTCLLLHICKKSSTFAA